jgi:DNA polymerase I-like protein with 3'-5' exonuclease and polymerase domains
MEVRGFAWYSKDPTLVRELSEGMDPHGVWAEFLGCSRFDAKNGFVFPLIYGSYWKSIHRELQYRGYKNISEELVRIAEDKFWEKYNYAKEWQNRLIYDYYKKGYVETFLGFKRRGVLRKNQIVNFPIQATCFHCLVWSYRRLSEIQFLEEWKTTQRGQIHDENLFKLWPTELAHVGRTIERVMVDELMERYDWINVPPIAEFAISKIGGSWAKMYQFTQELKEDGKTTVINDWDAIEGKTWEGEKLRTPEPGIVRPDGPRQFERGRSRIKK